jgi:predicted secreted protein
MRTSRKKEILLKVSFPILSFMSFIFFTACSPTQVQMEKKSGSINQVKAGEHFEINLPEDHRTLYLWSIGNGFNGETIQYMGSAFRSNEKGVLFRFEGGKPGKTEVSFFLRSYKDTSDIKTFVIEVK